MSAGRILTLGLGNPFSGREFLITFGLGIDNVYIPPPLAETPSLGGGSKRHKNRQRKWSEYAHTAERKKLLAPAKAAILEERVISNEDGFEEEILLLAAIRAILH